MPQTLNFKLFYEVVLGNSALSECSLLDFFLLVMLLTSKFRLKKLSNGKFSCSEPPPKFKGHSSNQIKCNLTNRRLNRKRKSFFGRKLSTHELESRVSTAPMAYY